MSPRDTDNDWEKIAVSEPYFGVLSENKFLSKNMTEEALNEFYESGRSIINGILDRLAPIKGTKEIKWALDFGCGAGRLVIPMAQICEHAVGIDIAANMRRLTQKRAAESNVHNLDIYKEVSELPANSVFDWINSYIVFQHIPPTRGYEILAHLLQHLSPGGFVSFHFPLFRDRSVLDLAVKDAVLYRVTDNAIEIIKNLRGNDTSAYMSMFDYDMHVLLSILYSYGIIDAQIHYGIEGGHFSVTIFGVKTQGATKSKEYSLGVPISFTNVSGNHELLCRGFGVPESWGVWTIAEEAELILPIRVMPSKPIQINIQAHAYTPNTIQKKKVGVLVNGAPANELYIAHGELQDFTIMVSPEIASRQSPLKIEFLIDAPISPAEAGQGNDFRKLGVALSNISVQTCS